MTTYYGRFALRVIFKEISERGTDTRAGAKGEIEKERKGLVGEANCEKIAFPHYDEIKVPSRIAVPPCFFRCYPRT